MRTLIAAAFFLLSSVVQAETLLEHIQKGEHKFYLSENCVSALRALGPGDFKSAKLQSWIRPVHREKLKDRFFFHYTNSDVVRDAGEANDLTEVFAHAKTHAKTLGNAGGAGFYIAADPKSSSMFGKHRLALELAQDLNIYSIDGGPDLFQAVSLISERLKLESCEKMALMTILLESNSVDVFQYQLAKDKPWFIIYNLEKITKSYYVPGPTKAERSLIRGLK